MTSPPHPTAAAALAGTLLLSISALAAPDGPALAQNDADPPATPGTGTDVPPPPPPPEQPPAGQPPPPAGEQPPPQYGPWTGQGYGPPGTAPPPPQPPPMVPAPEYARRPVELSPTLGLAFPSCAAGTVSNDRCEGVLGGGTLGFAAFWRVSPHFAWGGSFDIAGFKYDPPDNVPLTNAQAGAVWLGLLGRLYLNEEGSLDPYFQLGVGGGALGTTGDDPTGETYEETGAGPAIQIGGGIDFYLSRRLRLGPSLLYTRVFVDKIRRCRAGGQGDCVDVEKDEAGHLNAFVKLGVRLTIMLGDEL